MILWRERCEWPNIDTLSLTKVYPWFPSFPPVSLYRSRVASRIDLKSQLRQQLSALLCACVSPRPATLTPRASCASAPSRSFPTFGGCRPTWSRAIWPWGRPRASFPEPGETEHEVENCFKGRLWTQDFVLWKQTHSVNLEMSVLGLGKNVWL